MTNSPIGNFISILKQVRETALLNQGILSKSEASTRSSVIDPIKGFGMGYIEPKHD